MTILQRLRQQAASRRKRVLLPESLDPRVLHAAKILADERLATPVLLSAPSIAIPGVEVFADSPLAGQWNAQVDEALETQFGSQGADALRAAQQDVLLRAAVLLRLGYVDAAVAGSIATTAQVLRCGLRGVGLSPGGKLVSSIFMMELPESGRVLTYADCAVVPDPDAAQLAQIAVTSAASHQRLTGEKPYVALLSFSTRGSAEHAHVAKVREALEIARGLAPQLEIDGELQFDAALIPDVAAKKAPDSPVAGKANVFVFPDLDAGNIGYKITERLAGANAIGPILQGLAKPWMDLSRGCKAQDIANVAAIASVLSG